MALRPLPPFTLTFLHSSILVFILVCSYYMLLGSAVFWPGLSILQSILPTFQSLFQCQLQAIALD